MIINQSRFPSFLTADSLFSVFFKKDFHFIMQLPHESIVVLLLLALRENTSRAFSKQKSNEHKASIPADCFSKCAQALFFFFFLFFSSFCVFISSSLENNAGFLPSC